MAVLLRVAAALGVERDDLDGVGRVVVVVRFLKGQELGVALQFAFVAFVVGHCQGFQSRAVCYS